MDNATQTPGPADDSGSLEGNNPEVVKPEPATGPDQTVEDASDGGVRAAPSENGQAPTADARPPLGRRIVKKIRRHLNVYLLLFVLILMVAAGILVVTALSDDEETKAPTIANQSLSTDALKQLANTDTTVGDPKQILNVQSNAVFAGKVLVRGSLDVAGQINVGGALSLPGIVVSGDSQFDQVQINKGLNLGGDMSIQGQLVVRKNVSISGSGTFGGTVSAPQISTNTLQLVGDLNLTKHVIGGGVTPGRSIGGALGTGGTGSVSGSDTGGTINLNTGSGTAAGCLITVNFSQRYDNVPHVVITPIGSAAAGLDYYVNRTTSSFSICGLNAATPNASFGFDYIVIG